MPIGAGGQGGSGPPTPPQPELVCLSQAYLFTKDSEISKRLDIHWTRTCKLHSN